jgi:hypothetical protein
MGRQNGAREEDTSSLNGHTSTQSYCKDAVKEQGARPGPASAAAAAARRGEVLRRRRAPAARRRDIPVPVARAWQMLLARSQDDIQFKERVPKMRVDDVPGTGRY